MAIDDIESQHVGSKDGASIDMEGPHRPLINSIREMVETLAPPLTSECCIYRVPWGLRELNEAAYTPRAISIGPFHRGKKELQIMEKHKKRYLHGFLQRAEVSLEDLVTSIKAWEERVCRCYVEAIELSSDEFTKMILLDGGFIIEYFMRDFYSGLTDENDKVLYKPWLDNLIKGDLLLLENQLPFFVLENLYNLAFSIDPNDQFHSFLSIAFHYFGYYCKQDISPQDLEVKHFTDLVRTFYLPSSPRLAPKENERNKFSYSATELHEAGVKFKVGSSKCLFDIHFSDSVLQIPFLVVEDKTEFLIRNLMALEQCHHPHSTYICDYIYLMDTLINTAKDVELLVKNGIIFNRLGDNDVVATLFNNLCHQISLTHDDSYFSKLCEELTEHYNDHWHRWKATLRRDYFSTPWRIASTIAAVILLMLTFMQTMNSFISL